MEDVENRHRRQREQYRRRCDRETEEQRQVRLERCKDHDRQRCATMRTEQRHALLSQRRESYRRSKCNEIESSASLSAQNTNRYEIPTFNDPFTVSKMTEFHKNLMRLEAVQCLLCLAKFPTLKVDEAGVCARCNGDKHIPKLYCAQNNMDPGPVPTELTVSF